MIAFQPPFSDCCEKIESISLTVSIESSPTDGTKPSERMWKYNVVPFAPRAPSSRLTSRSESASSDKRIEGTPTDGRMVHGSLSMGETRVSTAASGTMRSTVSGRMMSYASRAGRSISSSYLFGTRTRTDDWLIAKSVLKPLASF